MATRIIDLGNKIDLDALDAGLSRVGDGLLTWGEYEGEEHHFKMKYGGIKFAGYPRDYQGTLIHKFFSLGGWTEEGEGRIEFGGPIVKGPHAYMFGLDVAVTAWRQPDERAILIAEGHEITVGGTTYRVKTANNKNYRLEKIEN